MKVVTCDGCGVAHHEVPGANVKEVRCGLQGGRVLDLCGECRKVFHRLVSEWLESMQPVRETIAAEGWKWSWEP